MKTFTFSLLLFFAFTFASCSRYYIRKGDSLYKTMQYDKAINYYNKAGKKTSDEAKIKIADCYRLNNDYANAEKSYAEVVTIKDVPAVNFFYYGKALMSNGKYKEAKTAFENYLKLKTTDAVATTLIVSCDSFNRFYTDSSRYALKQVEIPDVTTAFAEVSYRDGIVFAADHETFSSSQKKESGWTGRSYLDLYFSKKGEDGKWLAPEPLKGDINGPYHEGPAVFNKAGNRIFFTRSNYSGTRKLKKDKEDESNLALFSAEFKDSSWTNLKELPFNSNDYSCGHPALSPDGKTLYFISDMPGGLGGTDIYKVTSKLNKDSVEEWSTPENLGAVINTAGNEMFPYVRKDGSLFFSSDSHNTLGGLDIYSSSFNGKSWSEPENLNYPINSPKDDFAFVLNDDDQTGYISSNRKDLDKIYEIRLQPVFIVKGRVTEKGSGQPLNDAMVEITVDKTKPPLVFPVDSNGYYSVKLKGGVEYEIQAVMDGYLKPAVVTISTAGKTKSETFKVNFELEKIQMEKPIVLENIYYDLDKWKIRPDAAVELDKFATVLRNNPQINVELSSHTDARADDHYNLVLSEKRAKSAVEYLVTKGIDPNRLKWKGYGESMLVNGCGNGVVCKEEEHQQNRRTEFKITKINEVANNVSAKK